MLLSAADLLLERLKSEVPSVSGKVFPMEDLASGDKSAIAPALHLVLASYTALEVVGADARWEELWLVVAVVKHSARKDRASSQMALAAPILAEVAAALSNVSFHPQDAPPVRVTLAKGMRLKPEYDASHAFFPLAFLARSA